MQPNSLYFGDNLNVLRAEFPDESVDLIYLDPPFNSKRDYNMVFREIAGAGDTAQIQAFTDTHTFEGAQEDFHYVVTHHDRLSRVLDALKLTYSGDAQMLSMVGYLAVMAARLIEMHRVLKPTGTLYLHCDEVASHYLKLVLDAVFGPARFKTEVIWQRTNVHSDSKHWSDVRDSIFCYTKGESATWHAQHARYSEEYLASKYRFVDADGRRYQLDNMTSPNPRPNMMYEWQGHASPRAGWRYSRETMQRLHDEGRIWYPDTKDKRPRLKRYLDEQSGVLLGNIWTDIAPINSRAAERLGYPTQKPVALLERLIAASSNEGEIVLDPCCGCGTALVAAQKLGRRWCGIDITSLATSTIKKRLLESFPESFPTPASITVVGFPADVAGARELALADRHNFQNWVLSLLPGARPRGGTAKKGADQGIDGVWMWQDGRGVAQRGIISVKSGHVNAAQVRDLIGAMTSEGAAMGLFVTLEPPTKPMADAAAVAGHYELAGTTASFPRVQIVTAEDLLAERLPQLPLTGMLAGFKQAQIIDESPPHPELPL
jgi:site-specific DNA-methyltransferase (adenine-specific)